MEPSQADARPGPSEGALDPELAAALNSYTQPQADQAPKGSPPDTINPDTVSEMTESAVPEQAKIGPDTMVGTRIPLGSGPDIDLQQAEVSPSQESHEHHPIDVDMSLASESTGSPSVGADNIAEELDKVVAKFEEEMDKADKS